MSVETSEQGIHFAASESVPPVFYLYLIYVWLLNFLLDSLSLMLVASMTFPVNVDGWWGSSIYLNPV